MTIKLKDGRVATIKEGKGKDLFWAYQNANNPSEIIKLLMLRLIEINKKPLTEEELDEMPVQDVMVLMRSVAEGIFPLSESK